MKTWFTIKAQAGDKSPAEISIHDAIGTWNVNARDFLAALKNIKASEIVLTINSPGGSVFDGIAIYNGLRNHGANITVRVLGVAASIASVVAMAGDKIIMPENTFMMVHSPLNAVFGNAGDLRDMADTLDKVEASLIATYVARTGKSADEIKVLLDAETMLTAAEAVELGFADELEPALQIAASFELENLPENVRKIFKAADESREAPAPVNVSSTTFAEQVNTMAAAANLQDYVAAWLLDASLTTIEQAQAAITDAQEIRALCDYAKQPDQAARMIAARMSLADARADLCALRAAASDATHIDTTQPINKQPPNTVPPAVINRASIWAARQSKEI